LPYLDVIVNENNIKKYVLILTSYKKPFKARKIAGELNKI